MVKRSLLIALAATLLGLPLFAPVAEVHAQELPGFVVGAVAEVVAHKEKPFNSDNKIKQGSGVFADHGGCLYTNAHVVMNVDTKELEPRLAVNITTNRARRPTFAFEGEAVFVDVGLDLAYVCPVRDTGIFTEYFDRVDEPMFEKRKFGEEVFIMGFPAAGEGTITISPGHIIGFMENPDVEKWLGTPELDGEYLKIYKTDALSGPGVSGGVMVNSKLELVGVPFAGTLLPGAFIFSLSEDVYQEFDRRMRTHLYRENLVPLDCVYDITTHYYRQGGAAFYDQACTMAFDEAMEHEVASMFAAFCGQAIPSSRLVSAVKRSKELGDLSQWSQSIEAKCGPSASAPAPSLLPPSPTISQEHLTSGSYSYGYALLSAPRYFL
ncbi:MAG: trypsin-like peptidase domain-containing protein [Parcubacteria group bacterium]|nr:trypsin-like peptidase domain-containing protein [Parcubacteria group bacterium]